MVSPTDEEKDQQIPEESSTSDLSDTENDAEDSSNSETSEDEQSTFDVVMDAIKTDSEDNDEEESSSDEDDSEEEEEASEDESKESEEQSDEPGEEELKRWKPKTRKRFEDLQSKYREEKSLREQAEVEAGHYKQFVGFLEENRISQQEANELFSIGALMKSNPSQALQLIQPYYEQLMHVTGNVLPQDLQQQVQQGYVTKESALELSRLRANGQTQKAIQEEQARHQQQRFVQQQGEQVASMQTALSNWEQQWSSSDPDYASKKDRVLERVELTLARASRSGQLPQSVEQAVKLANDAKAQVEAEIQQFKPKKPVKTIDGGGSSSSLPEPKDTKDVIRRALNK